MHVIQIHGVGATEAFGGLPQAIIQTQGLAVLGVADPIAQRQTAGIVRRHGGKDLIGQIVQTGALAATGSEDVGGRGRLVGRRGSTGHQGCGGGQHAHQIADRIFHIPLPLPCSLPRPAGRRALCGPPQPRPRQSLSRQGAGIGVSWWATYARAGTAHCVALKRSARFAGTCVNAQETVMEI